MTFLGKLLAHANQTLYQQHQQAVDFYLASNTLMV
jgi:hypothetical protein